MSRYLNINGLRFFKMMLYNDLNLTKEEPESGDIPCNILSMSYKNNITLVLS